MNIAKKINEKFGHKPDTDFDSTEIKRSFYAVEEGLESIEELIELIETIPEKTAEANKIDKVKLVKAYKKLLSLRPIGSLGKWL